MKLLTKSEIRVLMDRLDALYPQPACELDYREPWQLLIAVILSAQCTDKRVNQITGELFRKYRSPEDVRKAPIEEIEEDIRSAGFFHNKAKSIKGSMDMLEEEFGGRMPETMEEMLRLPGVARKTANVVLGECFRKAEGIAVDTHVKRLSGKIGLSHAETPVDIERDLMKKIPRDKWIDISHQLILHGRRVCSARKPNCGECSLSDLCATGRLSSVTLQKSDEI